MKKNSALNYHIARIDLEALKMSAGELELDDPERMLKALGTIYGRVTSLRSYAKRAIAEREIESEG